MKYSSLIIAIFIILAGICTYTLFSKPVEDAEEALVYVDEDDNIDSLVQKMAGDCSYLQTLVVRLADTPLGLSSRLRPGRYDIGNGKNLLDVLRTIRNHTQSPVMLVVPSVRTMEDLATRLSQVLMADSASFSQVFNDSAIISNLGYSKETLPALFIPNSYEVWWTITPEEFLERMKKENSRFWEQNSRNSKASELGLNHEEIMTLASIVDEETAQNTEKARIAGLYLNRLRIDMPLQSDPTVKFGVGDFSLKRILKVHTQTPSPYNTYLKNGLPPGPIRIPSIAGIDAVLNHEEHSYIYMCAKEDFSGTHNFTSNFSDHLAAARRYTRALNERGIK